MVPLQPMETFIVVYNFPLNTSKANIKKFIEQYTEMQNEVKDVKITPEQNKCQAKIFLTSSECAQQMERLINQRQYKFDEVAEKVQAKYYEYTTVVVHNTPNSFTKKDFEEIVRASGNNFEILTKPVSVCPVPVWNERGRDTMIQISKQVNTKAIQSFTAKFRQLREWKSVPVQMTAHIYTKELQAIFSSLDTTVIASNFPKDMTEENIINMFEQKDQIMCSRQYPSNNETQTICLLLKQKSDVEKFIQIYHNKYVVNRLILVQSYSQFSKSVEYKVKIQHCQNWDIESMKDELCSELHLNINEFKDFKVSNDKSIVQFICSSQKIAQAIVEYLNRPDYNPQQVSAILAFKNKEQRYLAIICATEQQKFRDGLVDQILKVSKVEILDKSSDIVLKGVIEQIKYVFEIFKNKEFSLANGNGKLHFVIMEEVK